MGSGEAKKFRAMYGSAGRHGDSWWAEEKDNVGMKLLKGMGWTDGQGLGKAGQGKTTLVKQFRKKDNAGIGGTGGIFETSPKTKPLVSPAAIKRRNAPTIHRKTAY